jgi:hypothetical protein
MKLRNGKRFAALVSFVAVSLPTLFGAILVILMARKFQTRYANPF